MVPRIKKTKVDLPKEGLIDWASLQCEDYTLADFVEVYSTDLFEKARGVSAFVRDYYEKRYYTYCRILMGPAKNRSLIFDRFTQQPKEMIMMGSNNFLGLSYHPEVIKAGQQALEKYGSGTGSYLLNGCFDVQRQLEEKLADMKGTEACILFSSGYAANMGTISALVRRHDVAINDRLNHASIIDGCQLARCGVEIFRHNDVQNLEEILQGSKGKYDGKLVIVEGVYSMAGDLSPLPQILSLAKKHHARLMVDDAYGTGIFGANGHGSIEHHGLKGKIDIVMATFNKALGSVGGCICASKHVVTYIRFFARSSFFSASPSPVNCAVVLKAIDIMEREPEWRERLWKNRDYFVRALRSLGFHLGDTGSPIVSWIIGDDDALRKMSKEIHEEGLYISPIPYPAVPRDQVLFRMTVMATHTRQDLDEAIETLQKTAKKFKLI